MRKARPPRIAVLFWLCCLSLISAAQEAGEKALRLAIGDPKFKGGTVLVAEDEIISARAAKPVTFENMIRDIKDSRFIYVGESHDNMAMHDIQLRIIQALAERGEKIAIGLEMLPAEAQPALDEWVGGILERDDFLRRVRWYIHWNLNFGYYEKIFAFAKDRRIPIFALNAPRDVITKIRLSGWESLSEDEKGLVPRPDLTSEEHRLLIRTIFETTELPPQMKGEGIERMFEGLYRAQAAWDEVMAANAVRRAEESGRKIVVVAGSGHLLYNLGINRRVYARNRLPYRTVIAVPVPRGAKTVSVARSLADYVWGIAEQQRPAYPAIGLAFKKIEGFDFPVIERQPFEGAARGADFKKGDVILEVQGKAFDDINELRMELARYGWDDEIAFRILREGEVKEVRLRLVFEPPKTMGAEKSLPPGGGMGRSAARPGLERLKKQIENLIQDAEGEIGFAAKHLESGEELEIRGQNTYPMASVFKLPLLAALMAQIKEGKLSLEEEFAIQKSDLHLGSGLLSSLTAPGIRLSVRNLINLMMIISDNSATDFLLSRVGTENVNRRLREWGIQGISVDRSCQELIMDFVGLDYETYKGVPLDEVTAELRKKPGRSREERRREIRSFGQNPKDQSTPLALNRLLEKIFRKEILDPESCDFILSVMLRCQTGEKRILSGLPRGTPLAHKTGTIAGTVNDCGIITLPQGAGHVALTVLSKDFADTKTEDVEAMIAGIARFVFDYFYFTGSEDVR